MLAQVGDRRLEIGDLELEAVPAAGRGDGAVGHRRAAPRSAAGGAEHEPQVAAREHREAGRRVHHLAEAEALAVEVDRRVDVVDDVATLTEAIAFGRYPFPRRRASVAVSSAASSCRSAGKGDMLGDAD